MEKESFEMIKEIRSFEQYEDFIREISTDSNFKDPHFEYAERNLYDSLNKRDTKAYIVLDGEKVVGLFVWLVIAEERYIELLIGFSKSEIAVEEMLALIESKYPNYQMDFVIHPRNTVFRNVLERKKAKFDSEQIKMIWEKEIEIHNDCDVRLLTEEFEGEYIKNHKDNVYWTADRILKAQDRFRIFIAVKEEKLIGYLDVTCAYEENEPYALFIKDAYKGKGYEQALLNMALKMNKPNKMMVLIDVDAIEEIELYKSLGFFCVEGQNSIYAGYKS